MASKKSKKNKKHMPAGESLARELDECRRSLFDVILKLMNDVSEVYGDPERHQQTRRECAAVIEAYAEYAEATTGDQYTFNLQSKYSSDETVVVDTSVDESMAAAIEAYAKYAEFMTGDQYIFNLQSKYSSDETVVVDTFVDESMAAAIEACAEYAEVINTGDQYIFNSESKYSSETVEDTFVEESTEAAESSDRKTFANLFEEFVDKLNDMAGLLPVSKTGKAKAKEGGDINVKVKEKERTTLIKSGSDAKGSATDGEKEDLVGLEEQFLKMRFQSLHQNNRYISPTFEYNGGINVSTNLGTDKVFCKY